MRRDRRDGQGDESALVAAYVDGVAELSPEDRRAVEAGLARDPAARADHAAVRGLIDRLRALPPEPEGGEPDWSAMERSIRSAVGSSVPRPWWRRWTWLAPTTTLVTALAVLLVVMWSHRAPVAEAPRPVIPSHGLASQRAPQVPPEAAGDAATGTGVVSLWLDGAEVDVDVSAPAARALLGEPGDDEAVDETVDEAAAEAADDAPGSGEADDDAGLLPAADLAWVDGLDDAALARAERWLAAEGAPRKKG
ncbi:MAG TPA: hypothetical protein VH165_34745 [Kofleriaceae bacterium]|jgi:hypothetical protein|nr:hypothetical protein [Kofleriaceae bacterium]